MAKKSRYVSASELMARLQADPEWVRQNEERAARHAARAARLQAETAPEETPLLAELARVGHPVRSVWDLVNQGTGYPAAIPVLVKYLPVVRHPKLREGIARALTVKEARGSAGRVLLDELAQKKDPLASEARWTLANALTVAADPSLIAEIQALAADPRHEDVRKLLEEAIKPRRGRGGGTARAPARE